MNIKPMKSFTSNMFRMHKTLDVITLFHKPSVASSNRIVNLLKQASANASEAATEDQATHTETSPRHPFELEITEEAPTVDQLRSILEYVGAGKISELVKGASSESDAIKKLKESADNFQRPVVVDWNKGKAVVGENDSEILKLVRELPKDS